MPIDQALAVTRAIENIVMDIQLEMDEQIIRDIQLNMPQKQAISIPFSTFQYGMPNLPNFPSLRVWEALQMYQERTALEYIIPARVLHNVGSH